MGKIVFGIMTYDKEPYLTYTIRNLLSFHGTEKIIVTEGYERQYWDLSSCDWTEKQMEELNNGKIIYKNIGKVESKNEIYQAMLDEAINYLNNGGWFVLLGSDEVFSYEALDYVLSVDDSIIWIGHPWDNFHGDFRHILDIDWKEYLDNTPNIPKCYDKLGNFMVNGMYHERAFRWFDGYNLHTNFNSVKDKEGRYVYSNPYYTDRRIYISLDSDAKWCHYGYVGKKDWIYRKILYHIKRTVISQKLPNPPEYYITADNRYKFIFNGECRNSKFVSYKDVGNDYKHPYPMEEHPYYGKTREEILAYQEK